MFGGGTIVDCFISSVGSALLFENGDLFRDTLGLHLFVGSDRSADAIFTLMRAVRNLVVNGKPPAKKPH